MTTISTIAVLFPLWFNLTLQQPLTSNDIGVFGPQVLSQELAQVLRQIYPQLTVAERAALANQLKEESKGTAQVLLLEWLESDQELFAKSSILAALLQTDPAGIPETAIRPFLEAENPLLQNAAMRLYGALPDADFAWLATLSRGPAARPGFLIALYEALARRGEPAFEKFPLERLLEHSQDEPGEVAAAALKAALSSSNRQNTDLIHWQTTAAASPDGRMRLAAASNPHLIQANGPTLSLAKDPEAAVRLTVFKSYRDGTIEALSQLLALPADQDPVVRAARIGMLAQLPVIPDTYDVRRILREGMADEWKQVRVAAETILSGDNMPRELALGLTANALQAADDSSRRIAYRQILARKFQELLPEARNALPNETLSENLVAALQTVTALSTPAQPADLAYFKPFTEHRSPLVRAAAAHALGKLQVPNSEELIIKLATRDPAMYVKAHAFEAMGFFPQRVFLPTLAECFENREGSDNAARARAAAMWALPRIHPETEADFALVDQIAYSIYYFCTQPTIPEMMGMVVFDSTVVIANGLAATARLLKAYPERDAIVANGKRLLNAYKEPLDREGGGKSFGGGISESIPNIEVTNDIAKQGLQFVAGEEIIPTELKVRDLALKVTREIPAGGE